MGRGMNSTAIRLNRWAALALLFLFVAAPAFAQPQAALGLGHRIIDAQQVLNVKSMYAAILAAGALGYALNILFLVTEKRIVHWSGR